MGLWSKRPLRSIYDPTTGGYWFSVIDLCAILTDSTHKVARNYWKKFRSKLNQFQLGAESNQLKFGSSDNKHYYTEVVDFKTLIMLIQICPSPKANLYRLWLIDMLLQGTSPEKLEKELAKLGEESSHQIVEKYKNNSDEKYVRLTVHKETIL